MSRVGYVPWATSLAAAPANLSHIIFNLAAGSRFCSSRGVSPEKLIDESDSCDGDDGGEGGGVCVAGVRLESW